MAENYPAPSGSPQDNSCKAIYDALATDRDLYLERARKVCKLTIPRLVPENGANASTTMPAPFSSVGTRGVNNLASKLMMALFPPNAPFFKFKVEPYLADKMADLSTEQTNIQAEIEQNLVKAEEAVQTEIETSGFRVVAHEAMLHLLVSGNTLVFWPDEEIRPKLYHLDQYVVERDPMGKAVRIITLEKLSEATLPDEVHEQLVASQPTETRDSLNRSYDLFTHAEWSSGGGKKPYWTVYQECRGVRIAGSDATYSEDSFPYLPLRGSHCSGEHYSRSYGEEYLGDLLSLEGLSQSIVEGSAAMARGLFLVNPAGTTDINTLSNKPNWGFAEGNAADVTVLRVDKFADFRVAAETAKSIEQRLALAFLLNSSVQRQAERVTAEEIRFMAQELESALGGVYSLLSIEFQLPLINLLVYRMGKAKRLPKLPKKVVKPSVVTGIEALGRGNDLNRLREAFGTAKEIYGPEVAQQYTNPREGYTRIFTAAGVRAEGLVRTAEEIAQAQQQAQVQHAAETFGPEAIRQMGAQNQQQTSPQTG